MSAMTALVIVVNIKLLATGEAERKRRDVRGGLRQQACVEQTNRLICKLRESEMLHKDPLARDADVSFVQVSVDELHAMKNITRGGCCQKTAEKLRNRDEGRGKDDWEVFKGVSLGKGERSGRGAT